MEKSPKEPEFIHPLTPWLLLNGHFKSFQLFIDWGGDITKPATPRGTDLAAKDVL